MEPPAILDFRFSTGIGKTNSAKNDRGAQKLRGPKNTKTKLNHDKIGQIHLSMQLEDLI